MSSTRERLSATAGVPQPIAGSSGGVPAVRASSLLVSADFRTKRKMTIVDEPANETEGASEPTAVGSSWAQRFTKKQKPAGKARAPASAKPVAPQDACTGSVAAAPKEDGEAATEPPESAGERRQRPDQRLVQAQH